MKSLDEQIAALEWAIDLVRPRIFTQQDKIAGLEAALITLRRIRRKIIG